MPLQNITSQAINQFRILEMPAGPGFDDCTLTIRIPVTQSKAPVNIHVLEGLFTHFKCGNMITRWWPKSIMFDNVYGIDHFKLN